MSGTPNQDVVPTGLYRVTNGIKGPVIHNVVRNASLLVRTNDGTMPSFNNGAAIRLLEGARLRWLLENKLSGLLVFIEASDPVPSQPLCLMPRHWRYFPGATASYPTPQPEIARFLLTSREQEWGVRGIADYLVAVRAIVSVELQAAIDVALAVSTTVDA